MEVRRLEEVSETEDIELVHIEYDIDKLTITVIIDGDKLDIHFENPGGFRVLDEGDLLEFWPKCSSKYGWLFEIKSGGWLEQESKRNGFLLSNNEEIKEYFVAGINYCVNIFAWEDPHVEESIR